MKRDANRFAGSEKIQNVNSIIHFEIEWNGSEALNVGGGGINGM